MDLLSRENSVLRELEKKGTHTRISFGEGEICEFGELEIQMLKSVNEDLSDKMLFVSLW